MLRAQSGRRHLIHNDDMQTPNPEQKYGKQSAKSPETLSTSLSAATKALNIFELVEMIVDYLPSQGLIAVQRTSYIWNIVSKDIIRRSPHSYPCLHTTPISNAPRQCLAMLRSGLQEVPKRASIGPLDTFDKTKHAVYTICEIHPLLKVRTAESADRNALVVTIVSRRLAALQPGPGRDMFLSQPPITRDMIRRGTGPGAFLGELWAPNAAGVPDATPVTLGELQDTLIATLGGQALPDSRFIFPVKLHVEHASANFACLKEGYRRFQATALIPGHEAEPDNFLYF
ncbi:hypothetical protein DOTSEDRAFT_36752 [Dothistroma septosporum NZE10]|uniref:F-box domain-containing protein n=1 Tax=Dothistroma septosporum (strain NZE10 / CBS 128990) TaxID=675120 RepID=N1PJ40_DOTSN|nr:hypothetical protein DOTSEDRAFT_36752 [Dothistroma septosporum NZE10]